LFEPERPCVHAHRERVGRLHRVGSFGSFPVVQGGDDSLATIWQELKGGATEIGGVVFNGEDVCIAFARKHLTREVTYHCIPSHMFVMCMPLDEVIYKDDMQGDEMLAVWMSHNPMQLAVILLVHTTIPPILGGAKDSSLREAKYDFNAARTFDDWMPVGSLGGTAKNLTSGVVKAFDRIQGTINLTLGSPQAKGVMMELRGEFITHFRAILTTEVISYYQEILGKTGGAPPHTAEVKATCWAMVTKLLKDFVPGNPQGRDVCVGAGKYSER